MSQDSHDDPLFKENGKINGPFVLGNANLLLKAGEYALAENLFRLATKYEKLAHCAYYGLGQCALNQNQFEQAIQLFEKGLSLSKAPYIAISLLDALYQQREFENGEKLSLQFAKEFASDAESTEKFREFYTKFANVDKV